jgi:hypothetical protein
MKSPDYAAVISSSRLEAIRDRLNLMTVDLTRQERQEATKLAYRLWTRTCVELWGDQMGWDIPAYNTPEWRELYDAWVESKEPEL